MAEAKRTKYSHLFSLRQQYSTDSFTKLDSHLQHMGDLFPYSEILEVMIEYPLLALKYLERFKLLSAYSVVTKGCEKALIEEGKQYVKGSAERTPFDFWIRYFIRTLVQTQINIY